MVASNDLDRLQRLLADAATTLLGHFHGASEQIAQLRQRTTAAGWSTRWPSSRAALAAAARCVALQFQDMASQLIAHTHRRLRNCADRLARDAMADDDEDGEAVVEDAPLRPNPVTQDEMDAGSIELF